MARRKPSKRTMKKARNECCPLIRVKCAIVKTPDKRVKSTFTDPYTHKTSTFYKKVAQPPKKMCSVTLGSKAREPNLPSTEVGKRVAALKKGLLKKRCQAIVTSEK